jgi:hypothetical protein
MLVAGETRQVRYIPEDEDGDAQEDDEDEADDGEGEHPVAQYSSVWGQ